MPLDVRPCETVEDFIEAAAGIGQYGAWTLQRDQAERFLRNLSLERMHAARSDGRTVGGAGAFSFDLSVPGGSVPTAGVTVVGVYPTHRRRGVLRELMRVQLDDVRERGEPLAALWSSEERIYGRFGYGMASLSGEMRLLRDRAGLADLADPSGSVRLVEADEALELFPLVWDAVRQQRPGMFARSRAWWETRTLLDPEEWRRGGGPKRYVAVEFDGSVEGYAVYRHAPSWEAGVSTGELRVGEALGSTPRGTRETWAYLLGIDWVETITAYLLPPDHPLLFLLAEPRRMRLRVGDGLWLRLVDVRAALSARGYAEDGEIVLEVADPFCPWNEGRWLLAGGEAARTERPADLRLDVTALGSAYLGAFSFAQLADGGRVEELSAGALGRADRLFASPRAPWCPEIF
jgi:predicted acetyltransferase